jgi:hypothetical protein
VTARDLVAQGRYAELRVLADSGDTNARFHLARLLEVAGLTDELLVRARAGDVSARRCVALSAAERDDLTLLREMADASDGSDTDWEPRRLYASALNKLDAVDELRTRAADGDRWASASLNSVLVRLGDVAALRQREASGDKGARRALVGLAIGEDELRARTAAGDRYAGAKLVEFLIAQGRLVEATDVARPLAKGWDGEERLAKLLVRQGLLAELRERAENRDYSCADHLLRLLVKRGDVAQLRELADAGLVHNARKRYIEALEKAGMVDELFAYVRPDESYVLLRLLVNADRFDDLRALAAAGDYRAPVLLAHRLKDLGRADELRELAAAGSGDAAYAYVLLLADQGRVDELIESDSPHAPYELAKLLDEPALRARADAGDQRLQQILANRYLKEGRLDDLRAAGWEAAQPLLLRLLARTGHGEELRRLADTQVPHARDVYYRWLSESDRLDELAVHADAGDRQATRVLAESLVEQGRITELYERAATGDRDAAREMEFLMFPPDDDDRPDY